MSVPEALVVPAAQREVLLQADAVYYQDPPVTCRACEERGDGLCDGCAAGLERARAYLALGSELGMDTIG